MCEICEKFDRNNMNSTPLRASSKDGYLFLRCYNKSCNRLLVKISMQLKYKAGKLQSLNGIIPRRVCIKKDIFVSFLDAVRMSGNKPLVVIFKRSDGWTLGAQKGCEKNAYDLWEGEWSHYMTSMSKDWKPINEYVLHPNFFESFKKV